MSEDSKTNQPSNENRPTTRRDFLRFASMAAGAAVLAACGTTTTGGTGAGATATGGEAASGGATAPGTTGNAIEISQWYHQYGEEGTQQAAQRYADEYSKVKPNVKVNMVWTPGDYAAKLNAALLTPEGPDVFETSLNLDMVRSGQVVPLDDIYGEAKSDFNEVGLRANTVDGKLYGVKMIDDMGMLYYRKSMLEQAGVQPPTNLDELGAAITKLTANRVKGIFLGNDGGLGALSGPALWSSGHDFLEDDKPGFTSPEAIESIAAHQRFLKDNANAILIGAPTDWWDPSAFTQGLVAMQWTGLWAMPGIKKAIGDDFGVMAWPQYAAGKGKPSTFWGGWTQFVNAKSKHVEEAKAFVKWLWIDNTEFQKDWSLSYGFHVPPRKSAADTAEPLKTGPAAEAVKILNENGYPNIPSWTGAMSTAYNDALNNILKNGADAATELQAAAQKVQAELDKQ